MRGGGRNFRGRGRGGGGHRGSHRGHRGNGGFRGHHGGGRGRGRSAGGQHQYQNNKYPQVVGPRLSEVDVGITEFISKHDGFFAVMKHRYSDFQVNEIDRDGNVVKLTTLDVPKEETEANPDSMKRIDLIPEDIWLKLSNMAKKVTNSVNTNRKGKCDIPISKSNHSDEVVKVEENDEKKLSSDTAKSDSSPPLESFVKTESATITSSATQEEPLFVELDVTTLDKESRRAIHTCVKKAFKELNGNTIERDGKKYISFNKGTGARGENRGKWPESRCGEYLYFVVHKRNMDTTETINMISQHLRMKPNNVAFAGTKDRRGITSQLMSIRRMEPYRLFNVSRGIRNVFIGNYCFKTEPLRLGDLRGNQFRIALRNVEGCDDQINAGLKALKENGFINYYGLQRFGNNKAVPTYSVGKALLQRDWQKAVDLILEPRDGNPHLKAALDEWKTSKGATAALQKLQHQTNSLEELLLKGLAKHGANDFVNALSMIPLNTLLLYLHAYQSLIWNKTVSQRIKEFGLEPVVGDLVLVKSEKDNSDENSDESAQSIVDNCALPDGIEIEDDEALTRNTRQEVKLITEEDVKNYKIEDIVLPLPGYDVIYPNNSIGIFMRDLLKEDNLSSESFLNQVKLYSVRGTYRRMFARAKNVSWKVIHYTDPDTDLILTDFDELKKGKEEAKDVVDGKHKAIVLSMSLDLSTYATMAVREITKTDTSAAIQASMSAAAATKDAKITENEEESSKSSANNDESMSVTNVSDSIKISDDSEVLSSNDDNKDSLTVIQASMCSDDAMDSGSGSICGVKRKADESSDAVAEKKIKET